MQLRIGIEGGRQTCLRRARQLGAPILISANSLWDNRRQCFTGWRPYRGHDVALDSGGFVAMKRYGGYRWSIQQYVGLAQAMQPTWWAQMDFCCEPEIAADRSTVWKRIDLTAAHLHECRSVAETHCIQPPMPVLQGWHPEDYCQGPIYSRSYRWPELVGIGSVCRRHVHGPDGILAVVAALDSKVPRHVRFHLFGVKSQALTHLLRHFPHRVASSDSLAWNRAACWDAYHAGVRCDGQMRADGLERWYRTQQSKLK